MACCSLNHAILDSVKIPLICNVFGFGVVQKVAVVFRTPKCNVTLIQNIENLITNMSRLKHVKELCLTGRVERHDDILIFVQLFQPIIALLEDISEWDDRNSSIDVNTLCSSMQ